ncbi:MULTISPECIES: hypothetical protein [unclassified Geodermatophilus]|uniref:hypothetical protein n=1 Tax=unclassified Geodermatophilus TaxID=2637632 RepID=UPI003EEF9F12
MTAPAPPLEGFALLDRLILEAFTDLRSARAAAARAGNRQNLDLLTRAEEHLNALLEYRHAAARRFPPVGVGLAAEPRGRRTRPR